MGTARKKKGWEGGVYIRYAMSAHTEDLVSLLSPQGSETSLDLTFSLVEMT